MVDGNGPESTLVICFKAGFLKKLPVLLFILNSLVAVETFCAQVESLPEEKLPQKIFETGVSQSEVQYLIENYSGKISRENTISILNNSVRYRAYVRKRLSELNMPACLEYLPIIESDYKPTAKPPNGSSMGIWQFMPNSVHPYMELSEYIDERRDPWISTEGALNKLKANYDTFDDWLLALAAYNCGAGAVKRAIKQATNKTYSGLCEENLIPDHAKIYVKRFLALCNMIINAELNEDMELAQANEIYNIEDSDYFFYTDFDYITVNHSISLIVLAMELRIEYEILRNLNLSLIKDCTPPGREYRLRVPSGMGLACLDAIERLLEQN